MIKRRVTRHISIGGVGIGGESPVVVQSMTNTRTSDVSTTVRQIESLTNAGCEVVRIAVPDMEAAEAIAEIRSLVSIPVIADIHFDYRLALKAVKSGVDGLRINPGNIGSKDRIGRVVAAASERSVPIRIGINAGSLEKDILSRYGAPSPEAMVESALKHIKILEDFEFYDIKVSLKSSDVLRTVDAYELLSRRVDYPFHIGITEAGTLFSGTIKSSTGLGILLSMGLGDTMRVSLTGDPVDEVRVAWEILKALGIRRRGVNIISCPTCGRIKIDAAELASNIENRLSHITESIDIAIMGCVVNGPGEAIGADIGVAGGDGVGLMYVDGKVVKKLREEEIVNAVVEQALKMLRR